MNRIVGGRWFVCVLLGAVCALWPAAASAEMCGRGVAVRINEAGLDFVAAKVRGFIPSEIEVPALDQVVVDWPMTDDDARVQTSSMVARIDLKDFRLYFGAGNLHVAIKADVGTDGPVPLTVLNPYASFGSAECQADLQLRDLHVDIGAQVSTGGRIQVVVNQSVIQFDNDASKIALEGCALGSILTTVLDFVRKHFTEQVEAKLQDIARAKIPPLVEEKLSESIQLAGEINGFSYLAQVEALDSDPFGVQVLLGAELGVAGPVAPPPCLADIDPRLLEAPRSCIGATPALDRQQPAMFGAGVSEALASNAMHAVWRSGMLCVTSDELVQKKPQLGAVLSVATLGLGLPLTTRLGFSLRLAQPPALRMTQVGGLQLEINDLQLQVTLQPPDGPASEVNVNTSLTVQAAPTLAPRSGSVGLDLRDIAVRKLDVLGQGGPSTLPLDPARIQRFLQVVALPALQQKIADLQLSPAVIGYEQYLIELKNLQVRDGYLAAYFDAYEPGPSSDAAAPETLLVDGPEGLVGPQMVTVYVGGQDNETPESLLQYSFSVDGGAWSEPSFSRRIDAATTSGVHRVEVAAIDLQGNRDESPLLLEFEVDDEPPTVQITAQPPQLVDGSVVQVRFEGIDARTAATALAYQAQLFRVPDGGGTPEVVETQPFAVNTASAAFTGLDEGVYRIRVTVRDEAGNVGSADAGFAVERAGCRIGGDPSRSAPAAALLLLSLVLLSRAVRRRVSRSRSRSR